MAAVNTMFDIETLGTTPGCPVVAIGAVHFDPFGHDTPASLVKTKSRMFYRVLNFAEQCDLGLTIDASTTLWWITRTSVEARKVFELDPEPVAEVLDAFLKFARPTTDLWSNGPSFDQPILREVCRTFGIKFPVSYWNDRCVRTMKWLAEEVQQSKMETKRSELVAHDALHDCIKQVLLVQKANDIIFGG